jgi:trk system potassium uptake protein TrkH
MMSSRLRFLDALFEAISGVTTTGLSTKATLVGAPATFLFARARMQWYGGLGTVVLSLALVRPPEMMN